MSDFPWITTLTLVPLLGGAFVIGLGEQQQKAARGLALGCSFVALALALLIWSRFDSGSGAFQLEERWDWILNLGVQYRVAVDGLGLLMLLLTALVVPMALLASGGVRERVPIFAGLVLWLEAGLFGTFTALNFFHWFLFWELSLIPAFFLIKLWGGPMRGFAATQFFIYTMAGSVGLLLAFVALRWTLGTFDFVELATKGHEGALSAALASKVGPQAAQWLALGIFAGAFLGLAVKVPLVPLHTWLPAAYAEAPSSVTMLLTGLMSKMGVYGFLRLLLPIFPRETQAVLTPLLWLAVATIVLSAFAAFAQRDLKRLLAYSSINHLGYCLLGAFAAARLGDASVAPALQKAAALDGVLLQMFNHGLTAATLFWFVALIEQRSGGTRGLDDFGGLRKPAPVFCGLMGIAVFSSLGLPGLNGFVGEFLIFKGAFPLATWAAALSAIGLLMTAVFLLTLLLRVFNGPLAERWVRFPDLSRSETIMLGVPVALMLVLGIYPQLLIGAFNNTVLAMIRGMGS